MIKAIAIDDEPLSLKVIESFCSRIDFIQLEKTFTKPSEALKHLRKFSTDLLFLDIRMPSMSGIELSKLIEQDVMTIFTTAHSEYAVESYNLNATDYLLKPFEFNRFEQAVNKANEYYNYKHRSPNATVQHLFIRADYSLIKILISEILYIEGFDDYIKIHLQNSNRPLVPRMNMKEILEKLPAGEFIRLHRSFIIPFSRIENVRNKTITLCGKEIPIGKNYEEDFYNKFKK
ncbi:MAG TPA: DNA-binding response regulator [Bacteroidetes bacterium]|nr:DNA-binding response regulator [Bacteroidota bacterium]